VFAQASVSLLGIGGFDALAYLIIDENGLVAKIDVNIGASAGFGGSLKLGITASGLLEINTTSTARTLPRSPRGTA